MSLTFDPDICVLQEFHSALTFLLMLIQELMDCEKKLAGYHLKNRIPSVQVMKRYQNSHTLSLIPTQFLGLGVGVFSGR